MKSKFLTVQQNVLGETEFTINRDHVVCVKHNQGSNWTEIYLDTDIDLTALDPKDMILATTPSYETILSWLNSRFPAATNPSVRKQHVRRIRELRT